jgi:hypothetical protein
MRSTCVVTLVHGTWAQHAAWTEMTSPLVEALRTKLGDGVQVEPFQWSGRNSHYARSRAAKALRQHIQNCSERYFGADQFVIAHSHGGNVALYALRDQAVRGDVRGTVGLSTPFIYCRRRDLGLGGLFSVGVFLLALYVMAAQGLTLRLLPDWTSTPRKFVVMLSLAFLGLVFYLVLWVVSPALLKKGPSGVLSDLFESFKLPELEPDELFVVRAPGDEASSGLGATRVFSLLLGYVSRPVERLCEAGEWLVQFDKRSTWEQRFRISTWFLFFAGLVFMAKYWAGEMVEYWAVDDLLGLSSNPDTDYSDTDYLVQVLLFLAGYVLVPYSRYHIYGSLLSLVGYLLVTVAGGMLLLVIVLLSLVTAPFGFDAGFLAAFFELSAETTPPGSFQVFELHDFILPGLRHSLTYSDDATLDAIVKWIACRLTRTSP